MASFTDCPNLLIPWDTWDGLRNPSYIILILSGGLRQVNVINVKNTFEYFKNENPYLKVDRKNSFDMTLMKNDAGRYNSIFLNFLKFLFLLL